MGFQIRGEERAVTKNAEEEKKKKQEKGGGAEQLTAHCEVEEKDMFLSKINTSAVCQVLYNKRGEKCLFFYYYSNL